MVQFVQLETLANLIRNQKEKGLTGYAIALYLCLKDVNYLEAAQALLDVGFEVKVLEGLQRQGMKVIEVKEGGIWRQVNWYDKPDKPEITQDNRSLYTALLPHWAQADEVIMDTGLIQVWVNHTLYSDRELHESGATTRYIHVYDMDRGWLNIEFYLSQVKPTI